MKYLVLILILFSCKSTTLDGEWTASNFYSIEPNQTIKSEPIPFKKITFWVDSVDVDGQKAGIISDQISGERMLIFRWSGETRYFIVKELSTDQMLLETTSLLNGKKTLLSLKR